MCLWLISMNPSGLTKFMISFQSKSTCIIELPMCIGLYFNWLYSYNLRMNHYHDLLSLSCADNAILGFLTVNFWVYHPRLFDGKFLGLFDTPSIDGHNMQWFIILSFGDGAHGSLQKRSSKHVGSLLLPTSLHCHFHSLCLVLPFRCLCIASSF